MPINFPSSPSLNQVYTFENRSWRWNGEYWQSITVTTGYTGSRGISTVFKNSVPTEQDLPIPYGGDEGDGWLVIDTGFMYVWDGSSWGSLGQFRGYTGSQGAPGTSVRIIGSVATVQDLPTDGTSDGSTLLVIGDSFLVLEDGNLYTWNGSEWTNIGKIAGDTGPVGFTGSKGFGIIDTEIVNDELIITYEDSTQNNLGNVRGFQGSRGESSFTWGPNPPENPAIGDRWFDTIEGALSVYIDDGDSNQWVEVAASGFLGQIGYTGSAGLSGVLVQSVTYAGQTTAANTQGNETISITGSGFKAGIKAYVDSTECTTTFVDQGNINFVSPAKVAGFYDIVVYNTDGSSGTKPLGIEYSGPPVWSTAEILPSQDVDFPISISLSAASDSAVTYFLQSGSALPPGVSLSSAGLISGTVSGITEETTYVFTIVAIDEESQTTPRTFSLIVRNLIIVDYLLVAGGGGGGIGGGGGAGGFLTANSVSLQRSETFTITVGAGGASGYLNSVRQTSAITTGSDSSIISSSFSATAIGGGGGGTTSFAANGTTYKGLDGGSGGGSGGNSNVGNTVVTGGLGTAGQGNQGGSCPGVGGSPSGGGGGATQAGGNAGGGPGAGGAGASSGITGTTVTYAGGGGGGSFNVGGGAGGAGGGGGGTSGAGIAGSGTQNLGGGGGANSGTGSSGTGGSGVVVIAYSDTYPAITTISGGLTYDQPSRSGYRVYRFTAGTGVINF